MSYKAPKTITMHPCVQFCEDAQALGFEEGALHDVGLFPGWVFDYQDKDRTNMRFKHVGEFQKMGIIPDPRDEGDVDNILQGLITKANLGGKAPITHGMKMALGVLLRAPEPAMSAVDIRLTAVSMVPEGADPEFIHLASQAAGGLPSLKKRGVVHSRRVPLPGQAQMVPGRIAGKWGTGMTPMQMFKRKWFLKTRRDEVQKYIKEQKALAAEQWPDALQGLVDKERERRKAIREVTEQERDRFDGS